MKIADVKKLLLFLFSLMLLPLTPCVSFGEIEIGDYRFGGDIDIGGRFFIQKPGRYDRGYFEIYRDFPQGFVLERLDLSVTNKDASQYFQVLATEPGERDQNFLFRSAMVGVYSVEFEWDQLQHVYSTIYPTIEEIRQQWETARFGFTYTPTTEIDVSAEYKFSHKYGNIPKGEIAGGPSNAFNFTPFLEPIDYTEHYLTAGAELARQMYQFRVAYNLSIFENDIKWVEVPGGSQNFVYLPPSNIAHYVTAAGGVNLPYRTRVNASFSYGWLSQHDSQLPDISFASGSTDLSVNNILGYLSAVSRPLDPLTLKAYYRIFDYQDTLDSTIQPSIDPNHLFHYPFTKQTADFDAKWNFKWPGSIDVEYRWDRWTRDYMNGDTSEHTPKVAVRLTPFDWLTFISAYSHSSRDGSNYILYDSGNPESILLNKFYAADRERDKVDLTAEFTPLNNLVFSINYGLANDTYHDSPYGLLDDKNWSAGADISYSPIKRLALSFGYLHEHFKSRVLAGPDSVIDIDPGPELLTTDDFDTFSAGLELKIIPEKLDLTTRYSYSFSRSDFHNSALPDLKESINRLESWLRYRFTKQLAVKAGYIFETFDINNEYARLDFRQPVEYDLDGYYRPYTAHIMMGILQYKF